MRRSFWCGFVAAWASFSLYQDALGRDAYIEQVRTGWLSAWLTVPLALIALAVVCIVQAHELFVQERAKADRDA